MIIIMKNDATEQDAEAIIGELKSKGMQVDISKGVECTILGVIGSTAELDRSMLSMKRGVEKVMAVSEPYKKANRKFHPERTVIEVGGVKIGGDGLVVAAGPCSVESPEQLGIVARAVKKSGAQLLRGGAYKARTSPYAFQGLEKEGLEMLREASLETGLPIVSELTAPKHIEMFEMMVDVIQIGARNMQNFELLKEVGKTRKPILLKRGLSSTIEEWLMSAEYILSQGNPNVILCERGIRTFETYTRNTIDISSIPVVKKLSHLPVLVDPSHASGLSWMVPSLALAAVAAGADGLLIEVHNDPSNALCDGPQSITPEEFDSLMQKLRSMAEVMGRNIA